MFKHTRSLILAALALAVMAPAAFAAGGSTQVTVTGGSLSMTTPSAVDFTGITLNGASQTKTAGLGAYSVTDNTGTGAGWHVTAQATQFKEWDSTLNAGAGGYVTGGKTLAASSLMMTAPTATANGTTSTGPTITTGPYTLDGASAVSFASAAAGNGMGQYDFSSTTLSLTVPASAYARTYRSDLTFTVASTP